MEGIVERPEEYTGARGGGGTAPAQAIGAE